MGINQVANDADHNHRHTVDANILRRQREQAFREVGFEKVAEQKAVNGYSTIIPAVADIAPITSSSPAGHASDSGLSTPLIDISNLGGNSNRGEDEPKQQQQQHPLHSEASPTMTVILSPEAGLHRDGEQARLIEVVRRRQLQQRQHHEETTFQWLEESASQFWESILVYGGLLEDPRNDPIHRSRHSTMPLNPYRDDPRLTNQEKEHNTLSSSGSKTNEHPTSQTITDGLPSSQSSPLSKCPRIVRFVLSFFLRILYSFRYTIDFCITRLAHLEPLLPNVTSSFYSTSPVYSLQITADDILRFLIILWASFYCSWKMQVVAAPALAMMCLFIRSVSQRVVRRTHSPENERQMQQQQNTNQSIAQNEAAISPILPKQPSVPNKPHATEDQLHVEAIQRLQNQHPNATFAECKRFFTCVKYKEEAASKRIDEFFKWRSDCGLKTIAEAEVGGSAEDTARQMDKHARVFDQAFVKKDKEDWNAAAKMAISIMTKSHVTENWVNLPQIICSYEEKIEETPDANNPNQKEKSSLPPPRCKDGTRILHILPFRLDLSVATAPTYSLAAALYLDRRLSRSTTERITLFCDVRGGRGWANPTPWSALPFIQSTASLLGSHYPERLERLVLFPMPKSAIWVWSAAQKCLDPNTSSKVVVVSSGEGGGLPERLTEFVEEESLHVLEKRRRYFFVGQS
mmetsp:Transcript_3104/g.6835  ORF Transcript_3104/g.6835 Transcript_3104/m.6835 type:complete len:688 (+) Transcript_3104:45-2108(+)